MPTTWQINRLTHAGGSCTHARVPVMLSFLVDNGMDLVGNGAATSGSPVFMRLCRGFLVLCRHGGGGGGPNFPIYRDRLAQRKILTSNRGIELMDVIKQRAFGASISALNLEVLCSPTRLSLH